MFYATKPFIATLNEIATFFLLAKTMHQSNWATKEILNDCCINRGLLAIKQLTAMVIFSVIQSLHHLFTFNLIMLVLYDLM